MAATAESVLKELKSGKYAPIYFLQGEEPYYIDQISEYIENHALPKEQKDFNLTVMYGRDTNPNAIIQRARQFPMMAERTVIIIKEAQEISGFESEEHFKMIEAYFKNPLLSSILVFCYKNKKLDARKSLYKIIGKYTTLVTTEKIKDYKLAEWIEHYITSFHIKTTKSACNMVAENIGNDLSRIIGEIDKIRINISAGTVIDESVVEKYIGISKEFNVFELQKALLAKDPYKCNLILKHFQMNPKANPLPMIIPSLFGFFSKIVITHAEADKSESSLARVLKVNPFYVKDYIKGVNTISFQKSADILSYLRDADLKSKGVDSGNMGDEAILKELVFKILH